MLLAPALGTGWPLRQDHVAQLRRAIADSDLHTLRKADPELVENSTRIAHRPRTIGRHLVPGRRNAEDGQRVAGAQGAYDEVVDLSRVLNDLQMRIPQAELRDRFGAAGEETLLELRIGPRARHDLSPTLRADILGVDLDPCVNCPR